MPMPGQRLCGAMSKSKHAPCGMAAGWGTDHPGVGTCKLHGGMFPTHRRKGAMVLADMELRKLHPGFAHPLNVSAEDALLALVREASGNVAWLGARIQALYDSEAATEDHAGVVRPAVFQQGRVGTGYDKGGSFFGPEIALDRDGMEHVIGEKLRGMMLLYDREREHLRKAATDCLRMGIAKAQVEVAQQTAATLVVIVNRVFSRMGLDEAKQIVARELLAQEMRALPTGEERNEADRKLVGQGHRGGQGARS